MGTVWIICDKPIEAATASCVQAIAGVLVPRSLVAIFATDPSSLITISLGQCCSLNVQRWDASLSFAETAGQYQDREIAVIAPATFVGALICSLLDLPADRVQRMQLHPGGISRVIVEPHRTVIAGLNDCCHLQA